MAEAGAGAGAAEASVSLTADTDPWEKALDKAASYARGWGDKVEGVFAKVASFNSEKLAGIQAAAAAFGEQSSAAIGESLGGKLGTVVGTLFGPGVGTVIGRTLGKEIGSAVGENLDLSAAAKAVEEVLGAFDPVLKKAQGVYDAVEADAAATFGSIKEIIRSANVDGIGEKLSKGDWAGAWADVEAAAAASFGEIETLANRTGYRVARGLDDAFQAVKEPLAKVVDLVQRVLTDLGLVQADTFAWGDGLRSVGDIAETMFKAFAYEMGHLEGVFKKVGGYVLTYLVLPLGGIANTILKAMATAIEGIKQIMIEEFGDFIPSYVTTAMQAASDSINRLVAETDRKIAQRTLEARKLMDTDVTGTAKKREAEAAAIFKNTGQSLKFEQNVKDWTNQAADAIAAWYAKYTPKDGAAAAGVDGPAREAAKAIQQDSKDAQDAIQRSLNQSSPDGDKLVEAGKRQLDESRKSTKLLERAVKLLEKPAQFKSI